MKVQRVPPAALARLPVYVQSLKAMADQGVGWASSQEMARSTGLEASQIRRDLSYLGHFGTPGVGYEVKRLLQDMSLHLGLSHVWPVALVGCGTLGSALASYSGFVERNFRIVAVFDAKPETIGTTVAGIQVQPLDLLPQLVREQGIRLALVAVSSDCVQEVSAKLASSGIRAVLNLAPKPLSVGPEVTVRNIDLAAEMQVLSFHEAMNRLSVSAAALRRSSPRAAGQ
jgi:redox-sensing transcriptional repressor